MKLLDLAKKNAFWPVTALLVIGFLIRLAFLVHPAVDSDVAVVGLMGMHALDGEIPLLYWGQDYGGSLEALTASVLFAVFGVSSQALNAAPMFFSLIYLVLIYFIGKELFSSKAGLVAMALSATGPFYLIWYSVVARGLHAELLAFAALLILLTIKILKSSPKSNKYLWLSLAFGFSAGLAFWTNMLVVFFMVPCFLWIWWKNYRLIYTWPVLLIGCGFFMGSAPLWIYNLTHDWGTIHFVLSPRPYSGFLSNLQILFTKSLSVIWGTKYDHSYQWVIPGLSQLAFLLSALIALFSLKKWGMDLWQTLKPSSSSKGSEILFLALLGLIVIYSRIGGSDTRSHRYFLSFYIIWPLMIAYVFDYLQGKSKLKNLGAFALVGLFIVSNLTGTLSTSAFFNQKLKAQRIANYQTNQGLIDYLKEKNIKYAYITEYWDSHNITFQAKESVILLLPFKDRRPQNLSGLLKAQNIALICRNNKSKQAKEILLSMGCSFKKGNISGQTVFYDLVPPNYETTLLDSNEFKARAKPNPQDSNQAFDLNASTRWMTKQGQSPGQSFILDLGKITPEICQLFLYSGLVQDKPNMLEIESSLDKKNWTRVLSVKETLFPAFWSGGKPISLIDNPWQELRFAPQKMRYIKITQKGNLGNWWWSLLEIMVGQKICAQNKLDLDKAVAFILQNIDKNTPIWAEPAIKARLGQNHLAPLKRKQRPSWMKSYLNPNMLLPHNKPLVFALREQLTNKALYALTSCGYHTKTETRYGVSLITATPQKNIKLGKRIRSNLGLMVSGKDLVADLAEPIMVNQVLLNGGKHDYTTPSDFKLLGSTDGVHFQELPFKAYWPNELYWSGITPLAARAFPLTLRLEKPFWARYLKLVKRHYPNIPLPKKIRLDIEGSLKNN